MLCPFLLVIALPVQTVEPPARALALELSAAPRLAGTIGSERGAEIVSRWLAQAGWSVELDAREVLLCYPRRVRLELFAASGSAAPERAWEASYDPDRVPPGDVPLFSAWSKSGDVRAPVIDAGRGLRGDFEALKAAGVPIAGTLALVRYGGSYRGCKVEIAAEYGCAGVLLYSDPAQDGAGKGPTWPAGPWKPDHEAQRGSISSVARAPGDPSTPHGPSPPPGTAVARLEGAALAQALPPILCQPIGAAHALWIQSRLAEREMTSRDGLSREMRAVGPGPVEARLALDVPLGLRRIVNVLATLEGQTPALVIAGNHRDAWVRGMHDAGSGTVGMVRAAQRLGARAAQGWRPRNTLLLGFWDGEEYGLIGSTEWAEAHAQRLREQALVYVNADALVSGTEFGASGTPGLFAALERALHEVGYAHIDPELPNLAAQWRAGRESTGFVGDLPGSGSDFAVFLHHLALPVLDLGFHGNGGGQYHTAFDDFALVDRHLDPGWVGHELAGATLAQLLGDLAEDPRGGFDAAEASRELAQLAAQALEDARFASHRAPLLRLVEAARALERACASDAGPAAQSVVGREFYALLAKPSGLEQRPWFRLPLWAPGLETGYASETWPDLAVAARRGEGAFEAEVERMIESFERLRARCSNGPSGATR